MTKRTIFVFITVSAAFFIFSCAMAINASEKVPQYQLYRSDINMEVTQNEFSFPCEGSVHDGGECQDVDMERRGEITINPFTLVFFSYSRETEPEESVCISNTGNCNMSFQDFKTQYVNLQGFEKHNNGSMYIGDEPATLEYTCNQCIYGAINYFAAPTQYKVEVHTKTFGSCDNYCKEVFGGTGKMEMGYGQMQCNCYCPDKVVELGEMRWACAAKASDTPIKKEDILKRFEKDLSDEKKKALIGVGEGLSKEEKMALVEEVFGIDLSEFSENQGQGKTAYIIYGESVDDYREKWLGVMKQSIASIYMAEVLGYKPQVVYSRDSSETFEYMVQDDAPAIFYFGHLGKPSIDEVSSGDLPTQYKMAKKDNLERIYGEKRAHEMISEMGWDFFDSLGKDIFLNFSCFSADDSKLVERTVREGGVYFGHKGKLYPTEELEGFTRPFENK